MQVDLLYFPGGDRTAVKWALGTTRVLPNRPAQCAPVIDAWLETTRAEYVLFWHRDLPVPDDLILSNVSELPGDVWHAGLRLGVAGLPRSTDFVRPTWMFSRDPDQSIVATSWRISLRACLARTEVLRQLGGMDARFETIEAAGLDMGHRYLANGAIVRHVPQLVSPNATAIETRLKPYDELRFVRNQYGRQWVYWAAIRALASKWSALAVARALLRLQGAPPHPSPAPYCLTRDEEAPVDRARWHDRISVLIPTIERYGYLRNELAQLQDQTIRPRDIIVVDQTAPAERDPELLREFAHLPLHYIPQSTTGQCTAWNAAAQAARGDYLLFLGDDADRLTPDFLERFVHRFEHSGADMVASVVDEVGAGPPPPSCRFQRVSDIFPIAMVKRDLLRRTGLMDFAYDRAKRADGDLGMRCYLAGALMMLDPTIRPVHHRAPSGGLRKHGVRVITHSTSRRSIRQRHLPSASEIYLTLRYFGARQLREELWIRTFSSWTATGGRMMRLSKLAFGIVCLPDTLLQMRREYRIACRMLQQYPQIPTLDDSATPDRVPVDVDVDVAAEGRV